MGANLLKDSLNPKLTTILAVKERDKKMVMGTVVPKKGSSSDFVAKRVAAFIDELGLANCRITIKTDQEVSIIDLANAIKVLRPEIQTFAEHSPVGSSASNGVCERGVQTLEGQIRVLKDALETRWGITVGENQLVLSWLVEFAGVLINRCEVGHDGKTPYERTRGKISRILGVEFGERLMCRRQPLGTRLAKLESLWEEGVFLGYRSQSGEYMIGTTEGTFETRAIKRMVIEKRWDPKNIEMVVGTPWRPMPGGDAIEEVMPAVQISMKDDSIEIERPKTREEHYAPRRVYIQKRNIEEQGSTSGCPGCAALMLGKKAAAHNNECRNRIEGGLEMTARGKQRTTEAAGRQSTFFAEVVKQSVERRMRQGLAVQASRQQLRRLLQEVSRRKPTPWTPKFIRM
jgi:hypothetical protein